MRARRCVPAFPGTGEQLRGGREREAAPSRWQWEGSHRTGPLWRQGPQLHATAPNERADSVQLWGGSPGATSGILGGVTKATRLLGRLDLSGFLHSMPSPRAGPP